MQGAIFRGNADVAGPLYPELVEEYPRGLSEQWLSELRPLSAGVYGVRVLPGPHWLSSGFAGQNEDSFGVVRPATSLDLQVWAEAAWGSDNHPCPHCTCTSSYHQLGAWHPSRSAVVEWQIPGGVQVGYYKAGDEGDYDLYYHPADLARLGAGCDVEVLGRLCAGFEHFHAACSGGAELSRAISCCEARHLADPALRGLALGFSLQEVGETIFMHLQADAAVPRALGRRDWSACVWPLRNAAVAA